MTRPLIKRICWALFLGCALVIIAAWLVVYTALREPNLEGRPLSTVLRDLSAREPELKKSAQATIRARAAEVLPDLLKMLTAHESATRRWLREEVSKQGTYDIQIDAPQVQRAHAVNGFRTLGPAAASAVPELTKLLHQPETAVPAAMALAGIGTEGVGLLVAAITSGDKRLAGNAALALSALNADAPGVTSAMLEQVKSAAPNARPIVARALGQLAKDADAIVPTLITLLSDKDDAVRVGAAQALALLGPSAKAALPRLLELAQDSTLPEALRDEAGRAVWRADPLAAKKAGLPESLIRPLDYTGPQKR